MQLLKNKKWGFCFLLTCLGYFSQGQGYYEHSIQGVNDQWHRVDLPVEAFSYLHRSYASIRIYGEDNNYNTEVEQPYLLVKDQPRTILKPVPSNIINRTRQGDDYYFTFEILDEPMLSQINLDFENDDFDWKVLLEGSVDQKEWFTIVKDYRIVALPGKYSFTRLEFDPVNYPFLRAKINTSEKPVLNTATINSAAVTSGEYVDWPVKSIRHEAIAKSKNSELIIDLGKIVPVSYLKIKPSVDHDYYRNFSVLFLKDSLKTETGWREQWVNISSGTLSSFDNNIFSINENLTSKIKITIQNQDNQMLDIPTVEVKGAKHYLLARFDGKPPYTLQYGNRKLTYPKYDLASFKKNIPKNPALVQLEKAVYKKITDSETSTPLFANSLWLYLLMGIIILVLGGFTLSMIKNAKEEE